MLLKELGKWSPLGPLAMGAKALGKYGTGRITSNFGDNFRTLVNMKDPDDNPVGKDVALANLETSEVFRAVTAPLRLGGGRQGELMLDEFRRGRLY